MLGAERIRLHRRPAPLPKQPGVWMAKPPVYLSVTAAEFSRFNRRRPQPRMAGPRATTLITTVAARITFPGRPAVRNPGFDGHKAIQDDGLQIDAAHWHVSCPLYWPETKAIGLLAPTLQRPIGHRRPTKQQG
ncbi:MAG: hypothetical protein HYS13_24940 [Planctomycetia bacterium]|nr:hypothetical protein [Planctomycetia bacterium]